MHLLHVSDTHLARQGAPVSHPELPAPQDRLARVLEVAAPRGPFDAVLLTGDICDDGSTEAAAAVRRLIEASAPGVPVVAVPGNHDHTESVLSVFGPAPTTLGPWQVVTAATNLPMTVEGHAGPVVAALAEVDPARPTLVLMHHPLRSRSTHEWFLLRERHLLTDALTRHTAPVVLATGHTHEAFEAVDGLVTHLGAPSTYYAIVHTGDTWAPAAVGTGTGARLIRLSSDTVASEVLWA
ncbi:MAG: metallophosphoesterase [Tetrasphaera sp.]|nr:metallophosphoesterase [Tetrasphaera sp.]